MVMAVYKIQISEVKSQKTEERSVSLRGNETTEAILQKPLNKVCAEGERFKINNDINDIRDTIMNTIRVNLGERSYPVYVGSNILNKTGEFLSNFELTRKIAVLSNPTIWRFYGKQLMLSLKTAGFTPVKLLIPDGEKYKNLKTVEKIYTLMLKKGIDRKGCVVALGGGVIGDIAGFVAATYMRGIKFVQVPTTLLAQVDASIGGKTGVDHKLGKNLIGAFHQPLFVLSDISTLKTLPEREFHAGLAEVIKYGVIRDAELFDFMEKERNRILVRNIDALTFIVKRCSKIKAEIVSKDEREETGLRSILNFGHTIGHAIEAATGYKKYLHGEAVAMGMVVEAEMSHNMGHCSKLDSNRIKELIKMYKLKLVDEKIYIKILSFIKFDKKLKNNSIDLPVIKNIGNVYVERINIKDLIKEVAK